MARKSIPPELDAIIGNQGHQDTQDKGGITITPGWIYNLEGREVKDLSSFIIFKMGEKPDLTWKAFSEMAGGKDFAEEFNRFITDDEEHPKYFLGENLIRRIALILALNADDSKKLEKFAGKNRAATRKDGNEIEISEEQLAKDFDRSHLSKKLQEADKTKNLLEKYEQLFTARDKFYSILSRITENEITSPEKLSEKNRA